MTSAFEGSYAGTFEGECPDFPVSGDIFFDVDARGVVTGAIDGNDDGPLTGAVDDSGALESVANAMVAGDCNYDGQFDDELFLDGTWTCPDFGCDGTWSAAPAMDGP